MSTIDKPAGKTSISFEEFLQEFAPDLQSEFGDKIACEKHAIESVVKILTRPLMETLDATKA